MEEDEEKPIFSLTPNSSFNSYEHGENLILIEPCAIPNNYPTFRDEDHVFNFSAWNLDNPDYRNDIYEYESQFIKMIEAFLKVQDQFFISEPQEFVALQLLLLRHFILLCGNKKNPDDIYANKKPKPKLIFSQRYQILDEFVMILLRRLSMRDDRIRIEIIRILNRLSRTFPHFLNLNNIKLFLDKTRDLMQKDDAIPENQRTDLTTVLRHFTIILVSHVAPLSISLTDLYGHFIFLYTNAKDISPVFNIEGYYAYLKDAYPFKMATKHGDPYLYAIRKFTKVLSPAIKIELNDIGELLQLVFCCFRESNFARPTLSTNLKILNDLIQSNREGTLGKLQILNVMFYEFINSIFPQLIEKSLEPVIIKSCIKLISSFYQNGEEYWKYLENLNIEKIAELLLNDTTQNQTPQWLKIKVLSAKCIVNIIDATQQDGFEKFAQIFPLVAANSIKDEQSYKLRIAFIKLFSKMLQFYPGTEICFEVEPLVESFVYNLDHDDDRLIYESVNALYWLLERLKCIQKVLQSTPPLTHLFFNVYFTLNGPELLQNALSNENEQIRDIAIQFDHLIQQETAT